MSVHNEGAIASDVREHLFDPFRSSSEHRSHEEGLGLGLYIAQQIVIAHGGTLEVDTGEEIGTTFRVTLPQKAPVLDPHLR
jgi:signal transduction histidine kinase